MVKYIRIGVIIEAVVLLLLSTADVIANILPLIMGSSDYSVKFYLEYSIDSLLLVIHALCIGVFITAYKVLSSALRQ